MKNKKFLIIGIISAIAIITVVGTVSLVNNKSDKGLGGLIGGSYDKPYIPKGFEHTEGTIDEGYVIKHTATGNEFVWVPINGNTVKLAEPRRKFYIEESDDGFGDSVSKYGGFYIARYEAGCETTEERKEGASQELDALSKPNLNVYNRISHDNAVARAKEMATKQGFEGVQTRLVSAVAWDTTMNWFSTRGIDVNKPHSEYGNFGYDDTDTYKYIGNSLKKTGSNEKWCQCNIYDLAGNVDEWIVDFYTDGYTNKEEWTFESRGGMNNYGGICSMKDSGTNTDSYGKYSGFRVVLYK